MVTPAQARSGRGKAWRQLERIERPIAAAMNFGADHEEAINRSHDRCAALGLSRIERPDFGLMGRADFEITRSRTLRLHQHAAPVMELLYDQIVNTHSMVVLCDAAGTILYAIGDDDFLARAAKVAVQPGAIWSETHKGTNAVGTALVNEVPTLVHADEHYFHANHFLTCSAAPILDPRGNLLGALDVSGDHRSFHQHTMALVKMSARMIENQWLTDDLRNVMRLHFHGRVDFIGTLMEGIIAVRPDGRIVGANRSALEQLGMSGATLRMQSLETLFGTSVGALVDRFRSPLATPLSVRSHGARHFHLHARFDWPVWSSLAEAVAAQVPAAAVPSPVLRDAVVGSLLEAAAPSAVAAPVPRLPRDAQAAAIVERLRRGLDKQVPSVLIGDTGSGKEWLARTAHHAARPDRRFVVLACADSAPAQLDAVWHDGAPGTLYLDDIGHLPEATQHRLLQLLDAPPRGTPWALVCASREPWRALLAPKRLVEDLFYRLNGLTLRVPALRERSDLLEVARAIVDQEAAGRALQLDAEVTALLRAHRWPGNLRQMHNVLRAAVALTAGESKITRAHLSDDFVDEASSSAATARPVAADGHAPQSLDELTIDAITQAVDAAHGNISQASRQLGISRNTIYRKLRWNRHPN
jgi:sigma-54 dependent transcriptional regulator, acetoin dehydrogenase operon transcriptional activator AcoR